MVVGLPVAVAVVATGASAGDTAMLTIFRKFPAIVTVAYGRADVIAVTIVVAVILVMVVMIPVDRHWAVMVVPRIIVCPVVVRTIPAPAVVETVVIPVG